MDMPATQRSNVPRTSSGNTTSTSTSSSGGGTSSARDAPPKRGQSPPSSSTSTSTSSSTPGISWQRRACYVSFGILFTLGGLMMLLRSTNILPTRASSTLTGVANTLLYPSPTLNPASTGSSGSGGGGGGGGSNPHPATPQTLPGLYAKSPLVPTLWRVVRRVPHDSSSFTQGLAWRGRTLYEGSGMYGASQLRKVSLVGGKYQVMQHVSLPDDMFGEGVTLWPGDGLEVPGAPPPTVLQLTWTNGKVFTWDADSLGGRDVAAFTSTANQGWGLTSNGKDALVMSDGSSTLHFWNPRQETYGGGGGTMQENGPRVSVADGIPGGLEGVTLPLSSYPADLLTGGWQPPSVTPTTPIVPVSRPTIIPGFRHGSPLERLNELEWVHGWVLANVWYDTRIAIIDPATGQAVWYLDFESLYPDNAGKDCLNGIAYTMLVDAAGEAGVQQPPSDKPWGGRLWITGKYWNYLYEIELGGLVPVDVLLKGGGGGGGGQQQGAGLASPRMPSERPNPRPRMPYQRGFKSQKVNTKKATIK